MDAGVMCFQTQSLSAATLKLGCPHINSKQLIMFEHLCYERTRADLVLLICTPLFNYPIIVALDAVSGQLVSHFIYACIHLQGQHTLIVISVTGPG